MKRKPADFGITSRVSIVLPREEIQKRIPYMLIAETTSCSAWSTSKRLRLWNEVFTPAQRRACNRLISQAKRWALVTGVPNETTMTFETLHLWKALGEFCVQL